MSLPFFVRGLLIGFAIAAPVGPIGVLCIRRTLASGRVIGYLTGFGAASADAVYGAVAAFGLTSISALVINYQDWLRIIGGLFLIYLGVRTFISNPGNPNAQSTEKNYISAYATTFFLTLTNPLTILSFAGIFAGLGIATSTKGNYSQATLLVAGVFIGSILWWILLSSAASIFKQRLTTRGLIWVNRISGLIILGFGAVVLGSLIYLQVKL